MEQGAIDAYHYIQDLAAEHHEQNIYWPDRNWSFVMVPDEKSGFPIKGGGRD
ncbi:hypothetical protein [Desulforhopalus sp. 52FAK]